jgi:hypothetical protein
MANMSLGDQILDQSSILKKLEYIKASTESILYQPDISTQNESSFLRKLEVPLSQLNEDLSMTTTSADVSGVDVFLKNTSSVMDSYYSIEPNKSGEENPCDKSISSVISFSNIKPNANSPCNNNEENEFSIYSKKSSLSSFVTNKSTNNTSNILNQSILSKSSDQEENFLDTSYNHSKNDLKSNIKEDSFSSFKNVSVNSENVVNTNECEKDQLLDCKKNPTNSNNKNLNTTGNMVEKIDNSDETDLTANGPLHSPQTSKQRNLLNSTSSSYDFNSNLNNHAASAMPRSSSLIKGETSNQKVPLAYCTYNKRSNSSLNPTRSNNTQLKTMLISETQKTNITNSDIVISTKSEKSNDKSGTSV